MKKLKKYFETVNSVSHTTFNPKGPGNVRIHLIPPKKVKLNTPWVVILNGQDILPISSCWAVLLRIFIEHINSTNNEPITDEKLEEIISFTIKDAKKVFSKTDAKILKEDLKDIVDTLVCVAEGKTPNENIGFMKLKKYGKHMKAPHRMDLMVSSMYKNNHWHCNQKCLHCYAGEQEYAIKNELLTDDWKLIIDKCKEACISQITFTGGEPTLREDLVELIDYSSWFVTRLNTNGVLLTKQLCEKLYDASLDSVQITLYSNEEKVHNLLVGSQNFSKTIEGIKNAIESKLNVSVNTPLCSLNKNYLSLVKFLHEQFNIKYFTCSGIIITGNALNEEAVNTQLSKEQLTEILTDVNNYVKEHELSLSFTSPGWIDNKSFKELGLMTPTCGACLSNMAIAPNGDVIPCQSWLSEDSLGNLINDKFSSIWNSKKCKLIRKNTIRSDNICPLNVKSKKVK